MVDRLLEKLGSLEETVGVSLSEVFLVGGQFKIIDLCG